MKSAKIPENESARLEALQRYCILDTPPEPVFDELTKLAVIICDVPVATITFIDKDREWYKSKIGVSDEQAARDISLCAHTILSKDMLIIPDTLKDERFFDNPFVLEQPPLRFYAAVPLITPDGYALGTLCVIDHVPRRLSTQQINALQLLARQVMIQLEHHMTLLRYTDRQLHLFEHIISGTKDFISFIDRNYTYLVINDSYLKAFNKDREEIIGHTLAELFGEEFFYSRQKPKIDLALSGRSSSYETWIDLPVPGRRYVMVDYTPFHEGDGSISGVIVSARDITERKEAEETLHELTLALAHATPGISRLNREGSYITVNDTYAAMLGFRPEELIGRSWTSSIHPDDVTLALAARDLADREGRAEFEARTICRDGLISYYHIFIVKAVTGEGGMTGYHCFMRDITLRKKAEQELLQSRERMRKLAARLQAIREEERSRISREIHDELGQTLTGLRLDLAWILKKIPPAADAVAERAAKSLVLVDETLAAVQRISHDLRPAVLDHLGLKAAIELQMKEFQSRTGCDYELHINSGDIGMNPRRDTTLFRILQEALTNISRHARASCAYVSLKTRNGMLSLEIKDNGIGISDEKISSNESLGIIGMRERAGALGGNVSISRLLGGGTQVILNVPLAGE